MHFRDRGAYAPYAFSLSTPLRRIDWSRDRRRHVTLKGRGHDPNIFVANDVENGLRYILGYNRAPIRNGLLCTHAHITRITLVLLIAHTILPRA